MTCEIVVIAEAAFDRTIACELADRQLCEVDWIEPEHLPALRVYHSDSQVGQLTWKSLKQIAKDLGLPFGQGFFDGESGLPDAKAARRAIEIARHLFPQAQAIVLIRDIDKQTDREQGLKQARAEHKTGIKVVLGVAKPKMEAWVLAGFEPKDEGEKAELDKVRKDLGFDPRTDSHELTATHDCETRSAKRVLDGLAPDFDRKSDCWSKASLALLRKRGEKNGLGNYLKEIESHLKPLLTARPKA